MSICLHLGITPEQLTALLNIVEINLGKKSSDPLRDVLGQLTDKNESEEYEEDFIISIINTRVWNGRCQDLVIAKQGHFSVGGQTIQRPGTYDNSKFVGWATQVETGQSYRADHAFVDFQVPAHAKKLPLVYVHGYGGSGVCWQMNTRWAGWFRYSHVTPGV